MKTKNKRSLTARLFRVFSISAIIVILGITIAFFAIFYNTVIDDNYINKANNKILIYDKTGKEIELSSSLNSYVKYDDISKNIINAFVALEDKRFFKHNGIDVIRVFGAMRNNLKAGYIKEGGSTITQQLAKNTQLNNKKTLERKIREAKLARDIEKRFTKEEILEMYLNAIYFGNGIYGIGQACNQLFDKNPNEIEVFEAAILAGIVKNPSKNSPLRHPENADKRKNLVLKLMREQGYIDNFEYDKSLSKVFNPLTDTNYQKDSFTPFYNAVISQASRILNISEKELKEKGVKIQTYYDEEIQKLAHKAFESGEFEYKKDNSCPDYSVLILDNNTGGVISYYSSHNYSVFDLRRQPGSAIKPIISYAPSLNSGKITPATLFLDKKTTFGDYSPSNYMNKYFGWIDARSALRQSSNVVSVKLMQDAGIEYCKNTASNMGLRFHANDQNLSLALGGMTNGVTSLEISQAYMCLANGGMYTDATFIKSIYDNEGNLLYIHIPEFKRVLNDSTAYLLTDMLVDTSKRGTAKKLSSLNFQIASKTGTVGSVNNDKNTDAWNLSYTSDITMCVWYGNIDRNKSNDFSLTGGTYPTLLAKYIYENKRQKPRDFITPDNIIELKLDELAVKEFKKPMLATYNTPKQFQKTEIFDINNCPEEYSPLFEIPKTNLTVDIDENFYNLISFDTVPFFKYKVIKKNLTTGHNEVIYSVENNQGRVTFNDLNNNNDLGIISYAVEIDNKYCSMGICEEKFMISGIPITQGFNRRKTA